MILRSARALVLLTSWGVVRLLREGLVLRSMVWPGLVTSITLLATLSVLYFVRPGRHVAVSADTDPYVTGAIVEWDFDVTVVPDVSAAVSACRPSLGVDRDRIYVCGFPGTELDIEHLVRWYDDDATWLPAPLRRADPANSQAGLVCRVLALLFVLYGLVFGLGAAARDRDDGSLEAELSLPIPRWIGGFARWFAATLVLGVFFTASVVLFGALMPLPDPGAVLRHGIAAASTGAAIGLAVVGTSGLKNGFSGPFAAGMMTATALASVGAALELYWLPIGSLFSADAGWWAVLMAAAIGLASSWLYGLRVASA